jgi:hypothetical protein
MVVSPESDLAALEREMANLRISYERFFNGDLKVPPVPLRHRVEEMLKHLGNAEIDRAADRFRLQANQSRFAAFADLWAKRLVAKEEGRGPLAALAVQRAAPTAQAGAPSPAPGDASRPASVEGAGRVDFTPLFERYRSARAALGEDVSGLRYERFEELVVRQAEEIRRRTGSGRLVFEVKTDGGKVRLVGRSAAAKGSSST